MITVDSWPKTLPMPSVGSWNSTTETHLLHMSKRPLHKLWASEVSKIRVLKVNYFTSSRKENIPNRKHGLILMLLLFFINKIKKLHQFSDKNALNKVVWCSNHFSQWNITTKISLSKNFFENFWGLHQSNSQNAIISFEHVDS